MPSLPTSFVAATAQRGERQRKTTEHHLRHHNQRSSTMGCKKIFAILLASLLFAALVSVAPGTQRVVSDNSSGVADKKWTTQDLVQMGKSKAMAAAVSYMASDALQPGAKTLKLDG